MSKTFNPKEIDRVTELSGVRLASFSSRAIAFIIDFAIAFGLFLGVLIGGAALLDAMDYFEVPQQATLRFNFTNWYSILFIVLYFGISTYVGKGKTPGKWIMKIRVISLLHHRITLWHSVERALGYGASALELGFGFIQYFIHPNRRTVHDRIAETIVITEKK